MSLNKYVLCAFSSALMSVWFCPLNGNELYETQNKEKQENCKTLTVLFVDFCSSQSSDIDLGFFAST